MQLYSGRNSAWEGGNIKMKKFLKNLKLNEDNVSMGLGVVVVLIIGVLLINYFRSVNKPASKGETSSTKTEIQVTLEAKIAAEGGEYEIAVGDSLWNIADKAYSNGYRWTKIYEANKQVIGSNPSLLNAGTKITLPKMAVKEYTVVAGDNLWDVAVAQCQNGYVWPMIAADNKLANPRLIVPGQVLKVSCE